MLTHERFRELVLDYLYDLLDAPEAAQMESYLAAQPEARLELERARGLLAEAARVEFPSVRFEAPRSGQETVVQPAAPSPLPAAAPSPAPRSMRRVIIGWAIAAAALLAVGGLTYPAARHLSGYYHAKERLADADRDLRVANAERHQLLEDHNARISAATTTVEELTKEMAGLETERAKQIKAAVDDVQNKHLALDVTGPPAIQPGAPNSFEVTTKRVTDGTLVPSRITFRLLDRQNQVVYEEKDVQSQGKRRVDLPPSLAFKSNEKLSLEVSAFSEGKIPSELKNVRLSWAAPRYVTRLTTDKPMYQPGQTVHFRSVTLNRGTMQPPAEDFQIEYAITNPQGARVYASMGETRLRRLGGDGAPPKPVLGPDDKPVRGLGAGEFKLPDDPNFPGGEYTLTVRELTNRFPEEKRKFLVNKYTPDRINKELDFHRKTYGAGDEVVANCKIWNEAGPLANRPVISASYILDDVVHTIPLPGATDSLGRVSVRFRLPAKIEKGNGTLTLVFSDGGAREPVQKPIPLVVNKLFVKFFPEGGDLVAGLPNRVYFRATTPLDKPAELKGRVVDSHGAEVVRIETLNDDKERGVNQGLGVFAFTPKADETYSLKIDQPTGITGAIALPPVQADGVVLKAPTGVSGPGEPIRAELYATGPARRLLVGAYCRGLMLDHQRVETQPGKPTIVELKPNNDVGGVVRVTVFEEQNPGPRQIYSPKAERLVFRKSAKNMKFTFTPDKKHYAPGDKATITIAATDENGQAAQAITGVAVVNETIITMADEKTARSLPTHFMFVGEVKKAEDLEFADFLLTDHPKAPLALDLLLGTQGWRRFAEQDPNKFRNNNQEDAERILVISGISGQRMVSSMHQRQQQIDAEFQPKFKEVSEKLKDALVEKAAVNDDAAFPAKLQERDLAIQQRQKDYQAAAMIMAPYDETDAQIRSAAVPSLAGASLLLALVSLVIGASRGARARVVYYATAAGSIGVCALLLIGFVISGANKPEAGMTANRKTGAAVDKAVAEALPPGVPNDRMEAKQEKRFLPKAAAPMGPGGGAGVGLAPAPAAPQPLENEPAKDGRPALQARGAKGGVEKRPMAAARGKVEPDAKSKLDEDLSRLKKNKQLLEKDKYAMPDVPLQMADPKFADRDRMMPPAQRQKERLLEQENGKAGNQRFGKGQGVGGFARGDQAKNGQFPFAGDGGMPAPGKPGGGGIGGFGGGMMGGLGGGPGAAGFAPGGGFGGIGGPAGMPGGFRQGGFGAAGLIPAPEPFIVREYAHVNVHSDTGRREDFAETVFWNPALVLDKLGKQTVSFQVSDAITKYRVTVDGHTLEGRLGSGTQVLEVRKPFGLEAKLPVEVTAGDKLSIPLLITNDSDNQRVATVTVKHSGFQLRSGVPSDSIELAPNQRSRRVIQLQPSLIEGEGSLQIDGKGEPFAEDSVVRSIKIVPEGFPIVGQASDLLEKVAENEMVLPKDYVKGSLKIWANVYPSTLADLQKGLEGLLREPNGCFEQTSTSNYPNTLILGYIKELGRQTLETQAAAQRAGELLDRGYQKLTSFECVKQGGGRQGYEWFGGQAPPHEALTAYGLLQFHDMAQVHAVDSEMVARTRAYLLSRRKPEGGFQRNPRALDSFGGAPQHITDAYIVWALTETGKEDMTKDIDMLLRQFPKSTDPYFLSLLANALLNSDGAERANQAVELLKRVRAKQAADGSVAGAQTSITRSGGRDLQIETTALAMLAWMKANRPAEFTEPLQKAVKWINQQRGGYGGFGSTQSTILALKALIAYTKASKQTAENGMLTLSINGTVANQLPFVAGRQAPLDILVGEPEKFLEEGKNSLRLELTGKNKYPYTIGWSYSTLTPNSSDKCAVKLSTKLSKDQVREGEGVRLNVTLENLSKDQGQPMTVAVVGLPAGLKVPEDMKQLKEMATLRKGEGGELLPGDISFFEIRGRELVLYWRALKPGAKIDLGIDLVADIPGEYRGPASRAYLYYTSDAKQWVEPLKVVIEPGPAQ